MSYSIIFQTKIARLPDGRVIHFTRSGCNNDNAGRTKGEFTARLYTEKEFIKYAEHFKAGSVPYKKADDFELKIGSRYATYYDYGEHLLRMLRRAVNFDDLCISASYCKSIELMEPEHKEMSLEEFDKVFYELLYNNKSLKYRRIMEYSDKQEIVPLLESGKQMEFHIF